MKLKIAKLYIILLVGFGFSPLHSQNLLNVKTTSGTQVSYELNNIRKLTFSGTGNITVNTEVSTEVYALADVSKFTFGTERTAIDDISSSNKNLHLYPNPVVDVLNIQLSQLSNQAATVELLSIDGHVLYKAQVTSQTGFKINVSEFQRGIYLCRVNNGGSIETTKFLKK